MKFRTRSGSLKNKLKSELTTKQPSLDNILKYVDEYEAANLATIEKLKRKRAIFANRVNGALRQAIAAHGPITKILIGSATKRIMGALLVDSEKTFFQKMMAKLKKWNTKKQ